MRLIVGLTKKLGLPGYSSVGASCQIESSEFAGKLTDEAFRRRVERAFDACRVAVEEELLRHRPAVGDDGSSEPFVVQEPPATLNQLQALRTLTTRTRLADHELDGLFGGLPLESLSKSAASAAITRLRRGPTAAADASARRRKERFPRRRNMNARGKLNAAHVNGVFFIAGLLGLTTDSGTVFLLAAAVLLFTSWQSGTLRPPR